MVPHPDLGNQSRAGGQQNWHHLDKVDVALTDLETFSAGASGVRYMQVTEVWSNRRRELDETLATAVACERRMRDVETQTQTRALTQLDCVIRIDENVTEPFASEIP